MPNHDIKITKSDLFCPTATSRGNIQLKCGCTALFCLNNIIFVILFFFFWTEKGRAYPSLLISRADKGHCEDLRLLQP